MTVLLLLFISITVFSQPKIDSLTLRRSEVLTNNSIRIYELSIEKTPLYLIKHRRKEFRSSEIAFNSSLTKLFPQDDIDSAYVLKHSDTQTNYGKEVD